MTGMYPNTATAFISGGVTDMECYIKNISASRTEDGNVCVSWNWPAGYSCVRVLFEHKLAGREVSQLSPAELSECSDLCFMDEFRISGGKYIYPVTESEAGLLRFRVFCCDSPESTDLTRSSDTARIAGITLNVRYRITEKKSGKIYKKVTFAVESDAEIPSGTLAYRIQPERSVYTVDKTLPKGSSVIGPVIADARSTVTLELAAGHEDEFALTVQ